MARLTLAVAIVPLLLFCSCDEDELAGKDFDYIIYNESDIEIGIKIEPSTSTSGVEILESAFALKPGEEVTFMKSSEQKEPGSFLRSAEVLDKNLVTTYKTLDLSSRKIDGNITRINVWMPSPNAKQIAKNSTGVTVYIDETSIYGFFPKDNLGTGSYFFRSSNDLQTISKSVLPEGTTWYDITNVFSNTVIVHDHSGYAQNTSFLISNNNGQSWSQLFSVPNSNDIDFLVADFISPTEGWFFNYNYWDSTKVFKVDNNSYMRKSRLAGFCVNHAAFFDTNTGYVIANTKNNVSPADSQNAYLFKTSNGGTSWSEPVEISTTDWASRLFAFPSGEFFVMRGNTFEMHTSYYHSDDYGTTWDLVETNIEGKIRDMQFISEDIGFIKTGNNSLWSQTNYGFLYKTIDGGKTWNKIPSISLPGSRVYFFSEQIGLMQDLIYGEGQILLVTRDGGATWKEIMYPYDYLRE